MLLKTCCRCRVVRPITDFYRRFGAGDGLQSECKFCHIEKCRRSVNKNRASPSPKACTSCGVLKEPSEYYRDSYHIDGLQSVCKICARERVGSYRDSHREVVIQRKRVAYYSKPKTFPRKTLSADGVVIKASPKARLCRRCGQTRGIGDFYRNKNHMASYCKYCMIALAAERKQKNFSSDIATLTPCQWESILAGWDYRCAYCGSADKSLCQDHVTPVTRGGLYTSGNIVPACKSCNSRKGNKDVLGFIKRYGFMQQYQYLMFRLGEQASYGGIHGQA